MRLTVWKIAVFMGLFSMLALTFSVYSQLEVPAPEGPYAVGRTTINWMDASRPEVLTENPNDFREVAAMIWYPAEAGTGVKAGYFPLLSLVSDALLQSGEVEWWQVLGLQFIRSEIPFDAEPLRNQIPFPVVMLSPGNGTNMEFYSSLASEIASHGYIVIGINHPYDVPAVELSNGDVAPYDKDQWSLDMTAHQRYTRERIKVRTADILFVLEQLDQMNSTGRFAGRMDLDSIAVAGHSLGGITASESCKADARFKACLNYDGLQNGGPFSMEETAIPPEQPFMFLTRESQLHPKLIQSFESTSESYWVVVHGASHESFTDGPLLQPSLLPGPNQADELMSLIEEYSLAFLNHTLKGQPSQLLSGTVDGEAVSLKVFPAN
ncbi:MAG TPA: hypothetical protein VFQ23_05625 [Anaerolineales bacterium]|nr:hypothetical protein [Anaerolineales bacterium]